MPIIIKKIIHITLYFCLYFFSTLTIANDFKIIKINDVDIYLGIEITDNPKSKPLIFYLKEPPCSDSADCDYFESKVSNYLKIMTKVQVIQYLEETKQAWQECRQKYFDKCIAIGQEFWNGDDAFIYSMAVEALESGDTAKSLELATIAANNEYPRALHFLGFAYDPRMINSKFKKDVGKAIYWYQKAADKNWSKSQLNLAYFYRSGIGVEKNENTYFKLISQAVTSNSLNTNALYSLGNAFENGIGTNIDYSKAMKWYKRAANEGDIESMFNIGVFYFTGRGTNIDKCQAFSWFKKASDKGFAPAQFNLANQYFFGDCVSKNTLIGIGYLKLASEQGFEPAIQAYKSMR